MEDAHAKSAVEVLQYFGVDSDVGLTEKQILQNREKYGFNGNFFIFYMLPT